MTYGLILFAARLFAVLISAFQQKCAVGNNYVAGATACYARAVCDYATYGVVGLAVINFESALSTTIDIFFMGTGAAMGFVAGVMLHNRIFLTTK